MSTAGQDLSSGVVAGLAAGAAYLAEMAIDLRATRYNTDDLYLLGRMATADRRLVRRIGLGMHFFNAALFGIAYARIAHDRLPGPPWLRGATMASIENAALFPLTVFEQHHPGIRDGELASYRTKTAFLQNVARHIVFGAVLGATFAGLRARRPDSRPR